MRKIFSLVLATAIVSIATAQQVVNDANAEKRNVLGFHGIAISGGIDLYISQGDEAVAVSASEPKYRDHIKTEVKDGILKIWYENTGNIVISWGNRKLKAYVSFKNLDELTASGGSDIFADEGLQVNSLNMTLSGGSDFSGKIEASDLKVTNSGGSDVKISGIVKNLDIDASGGSDFKGYDLAADICSLQASGGSDIYITINKELSAEASGGSDVYYKGNGSVKELKSSGSSSIKKVSK